MKLDPKLEREFKAFLAEHYPGTTINSAFNLLLPSVIQHLAEDSAKYLLNGCREEADPFTRPQPKKSFIRRNMPQLFPLLLVALGAAHAANADNPGTSAASAAGSFAVLLVSVYNYRKMSDDEKKALTPLLGFVAKAIDSIPIPAISGEKGVHFESLGRQVEKMGTSLPKTALELATFTQAVRLLLLIQDGKADVEHALPLETAVVGNSLILFSLLNGAIHDDKGLEGIAASATRKLEKSFAEVGSPAGFLEGLGTDLEKQSGVKNIANQIAGVTNLLVARMVKNHTIGRAEAYKVASEIYLGAVANLRKFSEEIGQVGFMQSFAPVAVTDKKGELLATNTAEVDFFSRLMARSVRISKGGAYVVEMENPSPTAKRLAAEINAGIREVTSANGIFIEKKEGEKEIWYFGAKVRKRLESEVDRLSGQTLRGRDRPSTTLR